MDPIYDSTTGGTQEGSSYSMQDMLHLIRELEEKFEPVTTVRPIYTDLSTTEEVRVKTWKRLNRPPKVRTRRCRKPSMFLMWCPIRKRYELVAHPIFRSYLPETIQFPSKVLRKPNVQITEILQGPRWLSQLSLLV